MEVFHRPIKGTEKTVAYYVGDELYCVAAITIWVIFHFPFIRASLLNDRILCVVGQVLPILDVKGVVQGTEYQGS